MPGEMKTADDLQRERLVYTYSYTSDDDQHETPQSNMVKVITTVEEETAPDGSKVLRKKEESQQISKVTKIEKITRIHRHLMDPSTGELLSESDPKYQALMHQYDPSGIKHEMSGGFVPNLPLISSTHSPKTKHRPDGSAYVNDTHGTRALTDGLKRIGLDNENNNHYRQAYSNGRVPMPPPPFNGNAYNEPENNKTNTDEKIIDYDPNDPNLVDEPYLDVENPYEGLGPGRSDMIGRALLPTGGRHSPDSIGQGTNTTFAPLTVFPLPLVFQPLPATVKITVH